ADMLWPDSDPAQGRSRLSTLLSYVRSLLEPPGVVTGSMIHADRTTVRLNADRITTDVVEWEALLTKAAASADVHERLNLLKEARAICTGELLPGFYEDWIGQEQSRLREKRADMLHALALGLSKSGDLEGALSTIDEAIGVDPYREPLVRFKM